MKKTEPGLFGVSNSNRDFSKKDSWGKNQFNNSFPVALGCYMSAKQLEPVYITLSDQLEVRHSYISVKELYGMDPISPDLYFAFERDYLPYQKLIIGRLPSVDLVTLCEGIPLRGIEIKLTALPDNTTCDQSEEQYGCEIVVRTPTLVYLGLSIATAYSHRRKELYELLSPACSNIKDWKTIKSVLPYVSKMIKALDAVLLNKIDNQKPIMMQPVWKTVGKSPVLHENCLDLFVWSDFAFTRLFCDTAKHENLDSITRPMRSIIWLCKMLFDFANNGRTNGAEIVDQLSYNTKNDKAFAISGSRTNPYMNSPELTNPRVLKQEIKNIILNGGEKMLSPERRFDAVIKNTPNLFDN